MDKTLSRKDFLKVSGGALAGVSAWALAGCGARGGGADNGGGSASHTLKFSHVTTPDTPKGLAAQRFKKTLQKKTGGKIKVQIYPNS